MEELTKFRVGRNFVHVGDVIRVKPSKPRKRDGFDTSVRRITGNGHGLAVSVEVVDPNGRLREVYVDRVERRDQTIARSRYNEAKNQRADIRAQHPSRRYKKVK